jgi:hypothetical protein
VPTEMLTKDESRAQTLPPTAADAEEDELRAAARRHLKRASRLRINALAWALGAIVITTLWVVVEWQANGAFERFGHEGEPGQWNPTLWALAIGVWGLIVGIMALRVHFERPTTTAEVQREIERLSARRGADVAPADAELRRFVRARRERIQRLKFHVSAWVLAMLVLTPLWALIEWQDNGGFERFSGNSQPGDWEPWILYVGGVWALIIVLIALPVFVDRPVTEADVDRQVKRYRGGG